MRRLWQSIRRELARAWYDPAGIYSEHGREGL
jgi:hypothetical protein